jgi:hypothetical protein
MANDLREGFRYFASCLFSACLFVIINWFHFLRPVSCADCYSQYGLPFTFYNAGGFGGDSAIIWRGFFADLYVAIAVGVLLGWTWNKLIMWSSTRLQNGD